MSTWVIGRTYHLFGRKVGLSAFGTRDGRPRGFFRGDDGFSAWAYLDTLPPPQGVSRRPAACPPPGVDDIAEMAAVILRAGGWYCISGKHLRIARVADPHVRASFETAPMPVETKAERLRRKLAAQQSAVEVKTVGVDAYVALKKLRRRQEAARIDAAKLEAANRQLERMGVVQRNESFVYQDAVINAVRRSAGEVMMPRGAGKAATSPRRPRPAEVRYIAELEALPDSLYKRTQLRFMSLPKDARRDNSARRKAFDREVRKYIIERLPEEGVMTRAEIVNRITGEKQQ